MAVIGIQSSSSTTTGVDPKTVDFANAMSKEADRLIEEYLKHSPAKEDVRQYFRAVFEQYRQTGFWPDTRQCPTRAQAIVNNINNPEQLAKFFRSVNNLVGVTTRLGDATPKDLSAKGPPPPREKTAYYWPWVWGELIQPLKTAAQAKLSKMAEEAANKKDHQTFDSMPREVKTYEMKLKLREPAQVAGITVGGTPR
jgi:hypothetical protein